MDTSLLVSHCRILLQAFLANKETNNKRPPVKAGGRLFYDGMTFTNVVIFLDPSNRVRFRSLKRTLPAIAA